MRILLTTDTLGGVFTYTADLAAALQDAGEEVAVATLGPRPTAEQRARLPATVFEGVYALEWMEDAWDDVADSARWLAELEDELCPDVVHLCSYSHGSVPFRAATVLVAHSCVASWWRAVHRTAAPPSWGRYRQAVRAGLCAADAVVAPTQAMRAGLLWDYGFAAGVVIPNGSAAEPLAPGAVKQPYVLCSGRLWDAAKNVAALDAAAAGLAWPVIVAGELGDAPRPSAAATTGPLEAAQLAALRAGASIYAAPVRYEPFGLGILEAAAARCALVLGDIPSLREVWRGAALYADPSDPDELHAQLAALIADAQRREALAEAAQRRAGAFTIGRAAWAYRRLYQRVLAAPRVLA
jgi:glycosyltransferase involved in cell wall biosynthesis